MSASPEQILEQVRRVAEKCADRAHRAAGTHYASPHAGRPRRARKPTRPTPKALAPFAAQPGQGETGRVVVKTVREVRRQPVKATVGLVKEVPGVRSGISLVKVTLFFLFVVFPILFPTLYWWFAAPFWYDVRQFAAAVSPDFDDDFGPEDLPEWHRRIIPGALEACPGLQPVAASEPRPKGGAEGVAEGWGGLINRAANAEVTAPVVASTMRTFFVTVGRTWATFQQSVNGQSPAPAAQVQPSSVVPAADMSTKRLSDVEVAELARAVGWPEAEVPMVVARVKAESGGDPRARDYVDGSHQGLLQMGQAEQRQYMPGEDPFDPRANLRGARKLWEARGWQPWRASDSAVGRHLEAGRRAAAAGGVAPAAGVPVVDCGEIQLASMGPVGDLTPTNAAEAELSRNAIRARRAILAEFPGTTIGGWGTRPNKTEHDDRDHTGRKAARALDVMTYTDTGKGHRVASWVRANWEALNLEYMIWDRRIYVSPDHSRPYRGASPHTDHPHLTFSPDGVDVNA